MKIDLKRIIVLLVFSQLFTLFISDVRAEKMPCSYNFGKVIYDYDNESFSIDSKNKNDIFSVSTDLKNYIFKKETPHKCYTFYGYFYKDSQGILSELMPTYYYMYADYDDAVKNGIANAKDTCRTFDPIVGNEYEKNQVCLSYDPLKVDIDNALENYNKCSSNSCKIEYKNQIKNSSDKLKDSCKKILKFRPYNDEC